MLTCKVKKFSLVSTSLAVPMLTSCLSFGFPFTGIHGLGYIGASICQGRIKVCKPILLLKNPKALYLYCLGCSRFVCTKSSSHELTRTNECGRLLYTKFAKDVGSFQKVMDEIEKRGDPQDKHILLPLCPTRWVMRLPDAFLIHYAAILEFLETIVNDRSEPGKSRGKLSPIYMALSLFIITST